MLVSGSTFANKGVLISILQQYAKLCAARASAAEVAALQARIVAERDAHAGAVCRAGAGRDGVLPSATRDEGLL